MKWDKCSISLRRCVYIVIYVDDMFILENDATKNLSIERAFIQPFLDQISWLWEINFGCWNDLINKKKLW